MSKNIPSSEQFVAYLRVSTKQQGSDGLGVASQREIIKRFAAQSQGLVVAEFVEVETGKSNNRPQLAAALKMAKKLGATLLVGKLDRLSRNLAFIARLIESDTPFKACDNPHATKVMLQMLGVMAEWERDQISKRTTDALAAAKAKGIRLGNPNIKKISKLGREKQKQLAQSSAETLASIIRPLHARGESLRAIAARLTAQQIKTARGGSWSASHIKNIIARTSR